MRSERLPPLLLVDRDDAVGSAALERAQERRHDIGHARHVAGENDREVRAGCGARFERVESCTHGGGRPSEGRVLAADQNAGGERACRDGADHHGSELRDR